MRRLLLAAQLSMVLLLVTSLIAAEEILYLTNGRQIRVERFWEEGDQIFYEKRVYADSCVLKTAFLGNGGRKAATIFSLRYSSSR